MNPANVPQLQPFGDFWAKNHQNMRKEGQSASIVKKMIYFNFKQL
jgi:hypothetical protein